MASGYDQFFKEARKASGLDKTGSHTGKQSKHQQAGKRKVQFGLREGTPEDRLREELALRMKRKRATALKRKTRFPTYPVACAAIALICSAVGYYNSDKVDEIFNQTLGRIEIRLFGAARAAEEPAPAKKAEKTSPGGEAAAAKTAEAAPAAKASESAGAKGWTPEEMSFFGKLNERKQELDLREAELNKLEEELQKRKSELDAKLKQLEAMREQISHTLKTRVADDQQKVDKLVQFYSNMKPQQASKVIETLNEDLAVEVLDKMKKKNAAEILDMMNAKKARRLSELLTGYERTPSAAANDEENSGDGEAPAAAKNAKK